MVIEELLERPEYVDYWSLKWATCCGRTGRRRSSGSAMSSGAAMRSTMAFTVWSSCAVRTHAQHIGEAVTYALVLLQVKHQLPVIHEVLLLENEHVRVLDFRLRKGAKENFHTHPAHVAYILKGFKIQFSFTKDRLPGDTQVGTSIAQMLAAIGIDAAANAQPANVFFPARTRGEFSMSMSGWGTLTGEAHYTLSSLAHSNDKEKKMGAFNVLNYKNAEMDKLLQDAAVEMDSAKRSRFLEKAN
ncbi:MAG: hypothetical protein HC767_13530, partial [Akkermansiaceae bacterium]|nr:hypothetical protein [Akkermansiaceae bacterium]